MNWVDAVILILLAGTFIIGCFAGVIKGLMSLLGVGGGIFVAGKTYTTAATWFYFINIKSEFWAKVCGFAAIVLIAIIIAAILTKILDATFDKLNIKWVDRVIGGLFAMTTCALVIGIILTLWIKLDPANTVVASSVCAEYILSAIPVVAALLPDELTTVKSFFIN